MSSINPLHQMNSDIVTARSKASFFAHDMTRMLNGGQKAINKLNKIRDLIQDDPILNKSDICYLSRDEQLQRSLLICRRMIEICEDNMLGEGDIAQLYRYVDIPIPLVMHYSAFLSVIRSQGTDEQIEKWFIAGVKHAIIGCYAQTELGHGSNVLGLKTTAVYDIKTDEFIINTPDLTAAKWWIGALGVCSTHALVQAQLIVDNHNHGPHLFIVPLRSTIDLKPLKGIKVGDIGPKAYGGFSTMDNGYAMFDHVRIPRENMLMKFSQLTREGKYILPVHSKLSYGSMVKLRVDIVGDAGWKLSKAVTIAVRYCTVRRQFINPDDSQNGLEAQVISYSSVQHRLMPLLATAYALIISSGELAADYSELMSQLQGGNAEMLPEIHATSCALKIWSSRRASEGIEECRKAMGGHGFSSYSGVADLFASIVPANTYEGDNFVLCQQTARSLLKQLKSVSQGNLIKAGNSDYLNKLAKDDGSSFKFTSAEQILDSHVQLDLFGIRAARLVVDLAQQVQSGRPWADLNMECWILNLAHAEYIIMKKMVKRIHALESTEYQSLIPIIKSVADLFALSAIGYSSLATFLSTATIHPSDLSGLNTTYRSLITLISNNAVPLTDSFGFTDKELNTSLGKADGRAYEHLWERVQSNPVNHNPKLAVSSVYREY
ncbi:acyl-CoA dehydrogenase/oxidase C-terminal [Pilobolus umbonatus]|nr:acyl-CoA dehydrogenase/oxidase C-terminal [Pilobolus umbonatus]